MPALQAFRNGYISENISKISTKKKAKFITFTQLPSINPIENKR